MPTVSIIVPCFNEEDTIAALLNAIKGQTFPQDQIEVIVADGMSSDATRSNISEFKQRNPKLAISVIDNPNRKIPTGLNLAIHAAKGDFIVRLDAHCIPQADYVSRSVEDLKAKKGWNVGGVWHIQPGGPGWMSKSIALAASHPLGVGDALYRFTDKEASVDTVPFGTFEKTLVTRIGGFDESLETNEDYEFNTRIRQAGGIVWLDPAIKSIYYARRDLASLLRQYARYGYWKLRMLRRYPKAIRLRQAIPPLFVLSLLLLAPLSFIRTQAETLLKVEVVSYAALLFLVALQKAAQHRQLSLIIGIPLAMMTMHIGWGAAFLGSLLSLGADRQKTRPNG